MRWPRLTQTRVIFGIATLLSLYSAFQAFQYVAFFAQRPTSIWLLLGLNSGYWYTWALLAPLVIWLARRFPLDRDSWKRSLPVHLVAIVAVTLAHLGLAELRQQLSDDVVLERRVVAEIRLLDGGPDAGTSRTSTGR